uniref:hypothetical protein n=1 Tax=Navicula avium TaxID=2018708 RepID=UPI00218206F7|nr:hypothetical protein N4L39_pgp128 [Haslea avium]UVG41391.1 hypothetical protein [Haslea avium]
MSLNSDNSKEDPDHQVVKTSGDYFVFRSGDQTKSGPGARVKADATRRIKVSKRNENLSKLAQVRKVAQDLQMHLLQILTIQHDRNQRVNHLEWEVFSEVAQHQIFSIPKLQQGQDQFIPILRFQQLNVDRS